MASDRDLEILLKAMKDGMISPEALAQAGWSWMKSRGTEETGSSRESTQASLVKYLVERGMLSQGQVQSLETAFNIGKEDSSLLEETLVVSGATPHPTPAPDGPTDPAGRTPSTFGSEKQSTEGERTPPGGERYSQFKTFRKGGPGQIWLAWDNALGREVIVKSLRTDLAKKPAMLARFIREARITGQLEHPNIVPVYDLIGEGPSGANWAYSMRYLSGPTLAEAVDRYHQRLASGEAGLLDLVSLLDGFVLLCKAVAFAHARQVIHRDLKGQNVVLGDFGEVILLDWGLGKKLGDAEVDEGTEVEALQEFDREPLTVHGAINGTPAYMSLEVANGEPATKSSDIYSLGAILYSILTGRSPYRGTHPFETLEMVKKGPPPSPRSLNSAISPALEAITLKAMGRLPKDRYEGAEHLADDVRRWLVDEPVSVYTDTTAVRIFRWARKRRTAAVAAGAFLLTASVALAIGTALIWNEQRETLKQKQVAEDNYKIARELSQANINLIERSEVIFTSSQELQQIRKGMLDGTANAFRTFTSKDPQNFEIANAAMRVFRYAANVHQFDSDYDGASQLFDSSLKVFERPSFQEKMDETTLAFKAQILRDFSKVMDNTGKLKEAKKSLEEALAIYHQLKQKQPGNLSLQRGIGLANLELAGILMSLGEDQRPQELLNQSIQTYNELLDQNNKENRHPYDPIFLGHGLNRLGALQREKQKYPEALALQEQSMVALKGLMDRFREKNELILDGVAKNDLAVMAATCSLDRTQTWIACTAKPPEEVKKHFAGSIGQMNAINKENQSKRPIYAYFLIKALCQRGMWLDALGEQAAAKVDFQQARTLGDALAQQFEKAPRQHFYRGLATAALSKYENDAVEKQRLKTSGFQIIKASREMAPDDRSLVKEERQLLEKFLKAE